MTISLRRQRAWGDPDAQDIETRIGWDLGRVSQEAPVVPVDGDTNTVYVYDDAGQLTGVDTEVFEETEWSSSDESGDEAFVYDGHGNRVEYGHDGGSGYVTEEWAYTLADQLDCIEPDTTCATSSDTDFAYDYAGRRTATDDGTTTTGYSYDPAGRLGDVQVDDGSDVDRYAYTYDGAGSLTRMGVCDDWDDPNTECDGTATPIETVYDPTYPAQQLTQYAIGAYNTEMFFGITPVSTGVNVFAKWYSQDHRRSAVRNDTGPTDYTGFGAPEGHTSSIHDTSYRSELFHADHLLYLRNRNYDPSTGTFLTRDPVEGVDGTTTVANPYHYTNNDPVNSTDPLGLLTDLDGTLDPFSSFILTGAESPMTVPVPCLGEDREERAICFLVYAILNKYATGWTENVDNVNPNGSACRLNGATANASWPPEGGKHMSICFEPSHFADAFADPDHLGRGDDWAYLDLGSTPNILAHVVLHEYGHAKLFSISQDGANFSGFPEASNSDFWCGVLGGGKIRNELPFFWSGHMTDGPDVDACLSAWENMGDRADYMRTHELLADCYAKFLAPDLDFGGYWRTAIVGTLDSCPASGVEIVRAITTWSEMNKPHWDIPIISANIERRKRWTVGIPLLILLLVVAAGIILLIFANSGYLRDEFRIGDTYQNVVAKPVVNDGCIEVGRHVIELHGMEFEAVITPGGLSPQRSFSGWVEVVALSEQEHPVLSFHSEGQTINFYLVRGFSWCSEPPGA